MTSPFQWTAMDAGSLPCASAHSPPVPGCSHVLSFFPLVHHPSFPLSCRVLCGSRYSFSVARASWSSVRTAASLDILDAWWREVYPTSTYPSVILSTPICACIRNKFPFILRTLPSPHTFNFCFLRRTQVSSPLFSWVSFSVVSDYLRPHGLRHTRLPCPSPTSRAYSNSCLLGRYATWWCPLSQRFFFFFEIPCNWDRILFFFVWLGLPSVMSSSFIHVTINGRISFFF